MKLFKYKNYEEYLALQIETNKRKIHRVWAGKKEIKKISVYIKDNIPNPQFGICHGSRNGWEVEAFRKALGIEVIGTDISPTAIQFHHMIQFDFHKIKDEWIDNVDFIYSNSLDHSYDPEMCLDQWMKCIKLTGFCFIEWSPAHGDVPDADDPFGGTILDYRNMISIRYKIIDEILVKCSGYRMWEDVKKKKKPRKKENRIVFVIKRNN